MVSGQTARHGRRYDTYATAAGGQGLQALSPRRWPPLGAFIKLPALRVVHDFEGFGLLGASHVQGAMETGFCFSLIVRILL